MVAPDLVLSLGSERLGLHLSESQLIAFFRISGSFPFLVLGDGDDGNELEERPLTYAVFYVL